MNAKQLKKHIAVNEAQLKSCERYLKIVLQARKGKFEGFGGLLQELRDNIQKQINGLDASTPGFAFIFQAHQSNFMLVDNLREQVQDPEKRAEKLKSEQKELRKELKKLKERGERDHLG